MKVDRNFFFHPIPLLSVDRDTWYFIVMPCLARMGHNYSSKRRDSKVNLVVFFVCIYVLSRFCILYTVEMFDQDVFDVFRYFSSYITCILSLELILFCFALKKIIIITPKLYF